MTRSRRPLLCRIHLLAPMLLALVLGCANQPHRPTPAAPAAQLKPDHSHLRQLIDQRQQIQAEFAQLQEALHEFNRKNPDLNWARALAKRRTMQISQAHTAAELELIQARSTFGSGHPELRSRQQRLEELQRLYEQALEQTRLLNTEATRQQALTSELSATRDLLRRLDQRIARLEDRSS